MEYKNVCSNMFRYNPGTGTAELVHLAEQDIVDFEKEHIRKYGKSYFDIGEDGYYALSGARMDDATWNDPERLKDWALTMFAELEAEADFGN